MNAEKIILFLIAAIPFLASCGSDSDDDNGGGKTTISGTIEKGPFVQGSKVILYDLNSSLEQTGKNYTTNTKSDLGAFDFGNTIELSSRYGEFETSGYFYNECDSSLSAAPITLKAIADLNGKNTANVNLLTHLEYARVKYLVTNGASFANAKKQAEQELLKIFAITNTISSPEEISITDNNDHAAILLAISSILLYNHSEAEFSELISKFSNDFETDGQISDENVLNSIREGQKNCHPGQIAHAMTRFYSEKGSTITVPDFSKFVDFNGDGVIDENDEEYLDINNPTDVYTETIFEDENSANAALDGIYSRVAEFTMAQLSLEKLRVEDKTSISADNANVRVCWNAGYSTISSANQILNVLSTESTSYDKEPYINEAKAILAYVYYNMGMLWENIYIIKPGDDIMSGNFTQTNASNVYQYCLELLNNLNSFKNEDGHINSNFVNVLKAEIQLTLGNKSGAGSLLQAVDHSYSFSFNPTNIHSTDFIDLLKAEADGTDNSTEWLNRGAEYGTWAALKRLGKATSLLNLQDYELLMPIPSTELAMSMTLVQNPGYQ